MSDKKISQLTSATTPLAGTEVVPIVQSSATKKVAISDLTAGRDISASGATFTKSGVTQVTIENTSGTTKNVQYVFADNVGSKWRLGMDVATNNNTNNFQLYSDVGGASYMTMSSAGNLSLDVGNLVIGTAGKGIDFSATSGTGTSELFDDYEEGTFTPTNVIGATGSPTGPLTAGVHYSVSGPATYTKIGRTVFCTCNIIDLRSNKGDIKFDAPFTPTSTDRWVGGHYAGNITIWVDALVNYGGTGQYKFGSFSFITN